MGEKRNGTEQVTEFMNSLEHLHKAEIEEIRLILTADSKMTEQIKWNAPSFCYEGEDRITFNLHEKGAVRLIFHCGAKGKDRKTKAPLIEDPSGILEWKTADRAMVKFTDLNDVKAKEENLSVVIAKWIKAI
ncbi:DUF1801 domain-containing protein [Bacillus mangrovi]|uniref:DUF1801 domain-containing protein n=1 Tax=Metabacillus mangrovi TaxID=1491830 RepID=A0A7X2S2W2_9BACI|nr:DUF1801 domain-containing protein [Metabacillus mangrovi]MTH52255.1 DUF1801 domain-containing protein [Metabacillus mangrovi]